MLEIFQQVLVAFANFLATYGYVGLFAVSFIAAFALPVPSSSVLALSGALAARGDMNIYAVLIVALAGNLSADWFAFFVARRYGLATLRRLGFSRILKSTIFNKLEGYVTIHAPSIIYVTRVVTQAGPAVNILAGLGSVRTRTFLLYDVIGELTFVLLFGLSGYFLGDAWQNNTDFLLKGMFVVVSFGIFGGIAQHVVHMQTTTQGSRLS